MNLMLITHNRKGISLTEAVAWLGSILPTEPVAALIYSPEWAGFAVLEGAALRGPDGQPVDPSPVFEARLFSPKAELRWLNDPGAEKRHQAVILMEEDKNDQHSDLGKEGLKRIVVIENLPQTYLLWGEGTGRPQVPGWSELAAARIGAMPVPVRGVKEHQRVLLQSIEYLVEDEHGNVVVLDERLCKLEVEHA